VYTPETQEKKDIRDHFSKRSKEIYKSWRKKQKYEKSWNL